MDGRHVADSDCSESEKSLGKYVLCAGGYPVAKLSTFAEAAATAQVRMLDDFGSDDSAFSIYEVDSGIHFDVPRGSSYESAPTPALFDVEVRTGLLKDSSDISALHGELAANPVDRLVGGAIRCRRLQRNMTSARLAEAAHVAHSVIDDYEAGRSRVRAEHLLRIAETFGVSPSLFFGEC